jgi:phosphatidylglycerol:prolipoprotein diacylglycerol transferase
VSVDVVHVGLGVAAVGASALVSRWAPRAADELGPGRRVALTFIAIVGGTLAAKAPFVLADPSSWSRHDAWFTDGRTVLLGLAGGYLSVEAGKLALGIGSRTGDPYAAPVAAAIAVGRLACFWSGCCAGIPVWWGADFGDGVPRHPTQLYEAAFHGVATAVLLIAGRRAWWPTTLFQRYLLAYAAFRFATEWLRGEPTWAGLTWYQWASLGIGAAMLAVLRSRGASARPAGAAPAA